MVRAGLLNVRPHHFTAVARHAPRLPWRRVVRNGWKADIAGEVRWYLELWAMRTFIRKCRYFMRTLSALNALDRGEPAKALAALDTGNMEPIYPLLEGAFRTRVLMLCGKLDEAADFAQKVLVGSKAEPPSGDERAAFHYLKYALSILENGANTECTCGRAWRPDSQTRQSLASVSSRPETTS
jgi:hypothetical protein